jgi:hypothetical protein
MKHIDAYPFNCPACITDRRAADDNALFEEHRQDVIAIRAQGTASGFTRIGSASVTAKARHRGRR